MPKINKGGALGVLLFSLLMVCLVAGCHQDTIYTNGPQAVWGDASVYVDASGDAAMAVNDAQQTVYFWVGKWESDRSEYVKQWDITLGCHSQAAGKCECQPGDKMQVMFIAWPDTAYCDFTLGN